jgi:predicted DNA binding CopG/RHH family protein
MVVDLTQEENEIVEYIESGKAKSVPNVTDEISRYVSMAKGFTSKKKAISIRLPESDIYIY